MAIVDTDEGLRPKSVATFSESGIIQQDLILGVSQTKLSAEEME